MAGQIGAVAQANAASAAKSRAANEENSRRPSQLTLTTAVPSPFSAVPFPADSPRTQPGQGQRQTASATHQTEVRHQLSEQVGVHSPPAKQGHAPQQQQHQSRASNPFADVASTSFTDDSPATHTSGNRQAPPPEALQQPVSPFAAAAQMSKQLLSAHVQNTSRAPSPAASSQRAEAADPVAGGAIAAPVRSVSGGAWEQQGSESSAEDAAAPATAPDFQFNGSQLDTSFVFKRKPVSSMHARRLSTTTFHQGVLHTPRHHFSHIKPMADLLDLVEDPTAAANEQGNSQNKEVTVDDHSYLSQISRRALSTPDYHITPEGPAPTLQQQMRTRSTCANAILQSGSPLHMTSSNDLWLAQSRTHSGQQQGEQRQSVQGVMYGQHVISRPRGQVDETAQSSTVETPAQSGSGNVAQQKAAAPPPTAAAVKPQHDTGNGLKSQHDTETGPKEFDSQEEECMKPSHNSQEEGCAKPSQSEDLIKVKGSTDNSIVDSREQHAFWLTFTDPQLEAKYVKWFARKIGKVCSQEIPVLAQATLICKFVVTFTLQNCNACYCC